ncbi:MAG: hypothetical protein HYV29_09945 [Ignavibacteriales bacterium]|nr:hypothetical protein [Ignavibacteriales bacterium]
MDKWEFYNNVLAPQRGYKPLPPRFPKSTGVADRKLSVMDVGNVWARISNAATLGYDRWGLCYEFPAKSGFTYRWTMAPLIGAKKSSGTKYVASGTRGAARFSEEEFQPLKGFDAGVENTLTNIGVAFSDKPASWPQQWPNTQPISSLPPPARKLTAAGLTYTQPPVGPSGFPGVVNGDVRATREAYFVVTDNDTTDGNKPNPMDIRVDMWALQWDDILNQNFIVYKMILTNVGTDTLHDVYIGMHDDPDCPEQGGAEWTDDYAAFISPSTDVQGYDAKQDTLLWNFTYLWDGDDKVEGLIAKNVGWVGLKFLETPNDPNTGKPRGISTFQVFEYSAAPQSEVTEYDQLAAGIMAPTNVSPHARDWTQTPNSYGPDITYVVASGPFTLVPGQQLNFAFATIHAANKSDLFNNAIFCQLLYNANYQAAEPPPEPVVRTSVGDREVVLYWDDRSEKGIYYKQDGTVDHVNDRLTTTNAFQGYMIFKSTDRGITWGEKITDVKGGFKYWKPLAQYDLKDGVSGESKLELGRYFWLGDETGIKHTFVDRNVSNGYEYWYAVCAYDGDDVNIPPLVNSIKASRQQLGGNTVAVVPAAPIRDITKGNIKGIPTLSAGRSQSQPKVFVIDSKKVTGLEYKITFDTITATEKRYSVKYKSNNVPVVATGVNIGDSLVMKNFYDVETDNAALFDGLRLEVTDIGTGIYDIQQILPSPIKKIKLQSWYLFDPVLSTTGLMDDYEVLWGDNGFADTLWSYSIPSLDKRRIIKVPFYIKNITTGIRVIPLVGTNGDSTFDIEKGDTLLICNERYDTITTIRPKQIVKFFAPQSSFNFGLIFDSTSSASSGDKFQIITKHPLTINDEYLIQTTKENMSTVTEKSLEITAVPNPYIVSSYYETNKYGIQKEIQFHHLPPKCTIRIFNVAGDLVRTLLHDAAYASQPTIAVWDLQSYNGQEVAYGIYVYHVEVEGIGEYIGKLALIK